MLDLYAKLVFRNRLLLIFRSIIEQTLSLSDDPWACVFCGRIAGLETVPRPLCESRTCRCGAVALANRPCDFDEITDDAIGLFEVTTRPESSGYDMLLRQDIIRSGIEIRPGAVVEVEMFPGRRELIQYVWFRLKV